MSRVEHELEVCVRQTAPVLLTYGEPRVSAPPAPGKWSAKQIIGHLIDSAAHNHLRFVRAQFADELVFPGYEQESWVAAQRYQEGSWQNLVTLWQSYNLHIAQVIASIPADLRHKNRERHNLHLLAWHPVPEDQATTLEYFMQDYVAHLRHHIAQVFRALGRESGPPAQGPAA